MKYVLEFFENRNIYISLSQGITSASNFLLGTYALIAFNQAEFISWCLFSIGAFSLQVAVRNIFLEPDFLKFGQIHICSRYISLALTLLVNFGVYTYLLSSGNQSDQTFDFALAIYFSFFLFEDIVRYQFLSINSKIVFFADLFILLINSFFLIQHIANISIPVNQIIATASITQIIGISMIKYANRTKHFERQAKFEFKEKRYFALQSIAMFLNANVLNWIFINYLLFSDLRDYRTLMLLISPFQATALMFWIHNLNTFRQISLQTVDEYLYRRVKIFFTASLTTGILFIAAASITQQFESIICLYFGFTIILLNIIAYPLNLFLRKIGATSFISVITSIVSISVIVIFLMSRNHLSLIGIFATQFTVQLLVVVLFYVFLKHGIKSNTPFHVYGNPNRDLF